MRPIWQKYNHHKNTDTLRRHHNKKHLRLMKSHQGIIVAIEPKLVKVKIEAISACATCESHAHCGFAEKKDKIFEIETAKWDCYHIGDSVTVSIQESLGLQAVLIAYIVPSILAIAVFCILYYKVGELWSVVITLLTYGIYIGIIFLCRHKLQRKFTFAIS